MEEEALTLLYQVTFPTLPKQRCLAHVRRRINTLTTRNPQTDCGWELKRLDEKTI